MRRSRGVSREVTVPSVMAYPPTVKAPIVPWIVWGSLPTWGINTRGLRVGCSLCITF